MAQKRKKPVVLWWILVDMPGRGWQRVGRHYSSREAAMDWRPFVKAYWNHLPTKVLQSRITFDENGNADAKSIERLSTVFNCDVWSNGERLTETAQ